MFLSTLELTNFKNIARAHLEFSEKLNCFLGNNGMGKSNVLDAIHYLSFCKSFSGANDCMLIRRGEDFALIKGSYRRRGVDEVLMAGLGGRRKSFKRGGKDYKRLSAHIGVFPAVLVSPADMALVNGAAEERRRLLDMVISQSDARYLDALIRYGKALEQRNRMLRDGISDPNLFAAVETPLCAAAKYITDARHTHTQSLAALHARFYNDISGHATEDTVLAYKSSLDDDPARDLQTLLDKNRDRDHILKFTSVGPHRDDLAMLLDTMPLRRTASQGQAKSFTIALRLAQYELLRRHSEVTPLLLLDDIFDKLDTSRVENIMNVVAGGDFGQIFITDTNRKHLDNILQRIAGSAPHRLWTVVDGTFTPSEI